MGGEDESNGEGEGNGREEGECPLSTVLHMVW